MNNYQKPLCPGRYYHVFNRGNNRENLFYQARNSTHFLKKYKQYLLPFVDTYACCLLPNHFHLLIRVKDVEEVLTPRVRADFPGLKDLESFDPKASGVIGAMTSQQFRLMFMSYSKAINVQEKRVGSLFQKNFKRLEIESNTHCLQVVRYIHTNPQLHGLCEDFRDWQESSYHAILSYGSTKLRRDAVLEWFGGRATFEEYHKACFNRV